jgi:CheY-like chemotaxis protein
MGASVARVRLKDAARIAAGAAANGVPFTALLTDSAAIAAGAARLLPELRHPPRAVVIVDPGERGDLPSFRAEGFDFYLVRQIRPLSLLVQLFGEQEERQAKAAEALALTRPTLRAVPDKAAGAFILLAEDNDINALLATTVLEKSGARVVRARNGAEAVAKARNAMTESGGNGFDLVFMDIHMPDMDGVEAARHIRGLYPDGALPGAGRPPVVALTANAFAEDRAAYIAAGLDDYLAKPFEKADLAALFARWGGKDNEAEQGAGLGAA